MNAGNDFNGINIETSGILERIKAQNYSFVEENGVYVLQSPDGYKFYVSEVAENQGDPVKGVIVNTTNLEKTKAYWTNVLNMRLANETADAISLSYGDQQAKLIFKRTGN